MPDCNCRHCRYNRSDKGQARYARYAERGHKAEQDARWYAEGGWYAQTKSKLIRRIDESRQRLEACET